MCFVLLAIALSLNAVTKITVGDLTITRKEIDRAWLADKSDLLGRAKYNKIINNLIEEKTLMNYAEEIGVNVSEQEVDDFFITEYGNHPMFQDNGSFSKAKYIKAKQKKKVQKILNDLKHDLLISKMKSIVFDTFNISDEQLKEEYVKRKISFDMSYIVIDDNKLDISTDFHPEEAYAFFESNREKYKSPEKIKLMFTYIPDSLFVNDLKVTDSVLTKYYVDSGIGAQATFPEVKDSLAVVVKEILVHEEAFKFANNLRYNFQSEFYSLDTDYLKEGQSFGSYPESKDIVADAFHDVVSSQPVIREFRNGYLILKVKNRIEPSLAEFEEVSDQVWEDYINSSRKGKFSTDNIEYFRANIDSFKVKIARVTTIPIDTSKVKVVRNITETEKKKYYEDNIMEFTTFGEVMPYAEVKDKIHTAIVNRETEQKIENIKKLILKNSFRTKKLEKICSEYGFIISDERIYLEKMENKTKVLDFIGEVINDESYDGTPGFVYIDGQYYFYKLNTLIPGYIPAYEEVAQDIQKIKTRDEIEYDTEMHRKYFEENSSSFTIPDSLQLGGVYFPYDASNIEIEDDVLKDYFDQHEKEYYMDESVLYDYIYIKDEKKIRNKYVTDLSFQLSAEVFQMSGSVISDPYSLVRNSRREYKSLPEEISKMLRQVSEGDVSQPVFYDNGWFIFYKIKNYSPAYLTFNQTKESIRNKLRMEAARDTAFSKAKAVFDSLTYFGECIKYGDSLVFKTEFQDADLDFPPLGNIKHLKRKLMLLWNNEKYSSIVKTETGAAVVFLIKKRTSEPADFETALPLIKTKLYEKSRQVMIKEYINELISELKLGRSPDYLLKVFGEWVTLKDLSIKSEIPGIKYSDAVIQDLLRRKPGDYSSPIRLDDDHYMFYRVDRIVKGNKSRYYKERKAFREQLREEKYQEWLKKYQARIGVIYK